MCQCHKHMPHTNPSISISSYQSLGANIDTGQEFVEGI